MLQSYRPVKAVNEVFYIWVELWHRSKTIYLVMQIKFKFNACQKRAEKKWAPQWEISRNNNGGLWKRKKEEKWDVRLHKKKSVFEKEQFILAYVALTLYFVEQHTKAENTKLLWQHSQYEAWKDTKNKNFKGKIAISKANQNRQNKCGTIQKQMLAFLSELRFSVCCDFEQ